MNFDKPTCIVNERNTLGEGPLWDEEQQALYWIDITEKVIHRFDPKTQRLEKFAAPDEFSAIALCEQDGKLIAGTRDGFAFFNLESGAFDLFADPERLHPKNRMNDGVCDPLGRFWCGSIHEVSDPALRQPIASVYRVDGDHSVVKELSGIKTSNGFAWSPDGQTMYFTDTPTLNIMAYDYDLENGTISNGRIFATVPPNQGRPDGAAVDETGCLWSAHFAGSRVTRYSPEGEVLDTVLLPVENVTSCAFGGDDLSTLFITTATEDLTEQQLIEQPLAGGLFAYCPGVRGLPMHRFAG